VTREITPPLPNPLLQRIRCLGAVEEDSKLRSQLPLLLWRRGLGRGGESPTQKLRCSPERGASQFLTATVFPAKLEPTGLVLGPIDSVGSPRALTRRRLSCTLGGDAVSTSSRVLMKVVGSLLSALAGSSAGIIYMLLFGWENWRVCLTLIALFAVPVWALLQPFPTCMRHRTHNEAPAPAARAFRSPVLEDLNLLFALHLSRPRQ
jgi:hypothetical protein